jgi:hypothetical protein
MDMNERDQRDLERRLPSALQAAAPRPASDLADRLLARTAATPQRRGFLGLSLMPALAATAVLIAAVAVGIGVGALLPDEPTIGDASGSPSQAPRTVEATPLPSVPSPSPSPSSAPTVSCSNDELGFLVRYPAEWWANERVATDPELDPIEACRYFAEEPIELQQNAGLPSALAILAGLDATPPGAPQQPFRVVDEREVEVAERPATVREIEWTEDTGFQRVGDRSYAYRIDLPSGETLLFGTLDQRPSAQYEARKAVLDAMMETLELTGS